MPIQMKVKLSVMMFLEYFTWGAWYVTLGTYLISNFQSGAVQVGSAYANLAIAAIVSPFFVGLIADKFFAAQRVMGVLHLLGALTLYMLSRLENYEVFWWFLLLYTVLYMPTMALANAITFRQLGDDVKGFPFIRSFGTVGWIFSGLLIGFAGIESAPYTFILAAISSALLGILSFTLPNMPPTENSRAQTIASMLGAEALVLFKKRSFVVFFLSSLAICIPLSFYYSFANPFLNDVGMSNAAGKMTLGQVSEFLFMLLIPIAFRRFGLKTILVAGIGAWIMRYMLFAFGNADDAIWMLYVGILLHGICYDFFFVTGQMYVDREAGDRIKNAAQGLITFATYGVGMLIGSYVSGIITARYTLPAGSATQFDWGKVWSIPAGIAALVLLVFWIFFRDKAVRND